MSVKSNQIKAQQELERLARERAELWSKEQGLLADATAAEQKTSQATTYAVIGVVVVMVLVVLIVLMKKKK